MFDANVSDEIKQQIVVTYSQNSNIVESPVDAGDYLAVFKFEGNTNNYIFDFATTIETAMELHISKEMLKFWRCHNNLFMEIVYLHLSIV